MRDAVEDKSFCGCRPKTGVAVPCINMLYEESLSYVVISASLYAMTSCEVLVVRLDTVTDEDARLALLQTELNSIQSAIRGLDTILFQIKGWCVTTALAIGGFAVAYHLPALIIVGAGAVVGFYMMNCQFKMIQRAFIRRNRELDTELKAVGVMQFLKGAGNINIVGTSVVHLGVDSKVPETYFRRVVRYLPSLWFEARLPDTFSLYLFILACLAAEAIILL
jgi:hypothetical protein